MSKYLNKGLKVPKLPKSSKLRAFQPVSYSKDVVTLASICEPIWLNRSKVHPFNPLTPKNKYKTVYNFGVKLKVVKPGYVYYIKFTIPGYVYNTINPLTFIDKPIILYKLGYTSTSVKKRIEFMNVSSQIKVEILQVLTMKCVKDSFYLEQMLHGLHFKDRYMGNGFLSSGNTELYSKDIFGLDDKGRMVKSKFIY